MAATGNKNNWKGGVAKWPEIRVRVPPEVKEALAALDWHTANEQVLRILRAWDEERIRKLKQLGKFEEGEKHGKRSK